jgi:hypothetical protein
MKRSWIKRKSPLKSGKILQFGRKRGLQAILAVDSPDGGSAIPEASNASRTKPRKPLKARKRLKPRKYSKNPTVGGASRSQLKDECDSLVRSIVALRDDKCINVDCRETEGLHVGHYIKRGVLALRWDLRNCHAQCDFHNELHNTTPRLYQHAMILRYGIGATWKIEEKGERNPRLSYVEILAIRDGLRQALADLVAEQS